MRSNVLVVAVMTIAACGGEIAEKNNTPPIGQISQGEQWSDRDNPALFTSNLESKLDTLPIEGEAENIPWPGSYWPTYQDSINYSWDGTDSPAKKYEKAFNGSNVENAVSRYFGIDSVGGRECTRDYQCWGSSFDAICAKRRGAQRGRCISTWWGICHGWAPAAIKFPEPKHPVTKNGVTFKIQDIKALASVVYTSANTKFVSLRCDKTDDEIHLDSDGRPDNSSAECRDTNPGTYHILLANYLGNMHQAFVEDRTIDYQVWNQPLRRYRVIEQRAVSATEANQLIGTQGGGSASTTTYTRTGRVNRGAWAHQGSFPITAPGKVKVIMTGSGDPDLYVRFGSQPDSSNYDCRPYKNGASEICELAVPAQASAVFVSVNGYSRSSTYSLQIVVPSGASSGAYVFNPHATSFAYLKTLVYYIGESSSSTDGSLLGAIDDYTYIDTYEYVLELDASGKIIGGEWVGASKMNHPDFLWLPLGPGTSSVAGGAISYEMVKELVDESVNGG